VCPNATKDIITESMDAWPYWKMVARSARAKTLVHIVQKLLIGLVISMTAALAQYLLKLRSLSDTWKIVISVVTGPVVVGAFFFVKNLIAEPALIYAEKPKRTPAQQHYYDEARAALEMIGQDAITVLRHLTTHGELTFIMRPSGSSGPPYAQSPLASGMNLMETYMCLEKCAYKSLVSPVHRHVSLGPNQPYPATYIDYHIAEGMKEAIGELLYPAAEGK
jgi:hypothetical protein